MCTPLVVASVGLLAGALAGALMGFGVGLLVDVALLQTLGGIGFQLGDYDHSRPLIIDPVLVYSTYLGGGDIINATEDWGEAIAVDNAGSAYVTGYTTSTGCGGTATDPVSSTASTPCTRPSATSRSASW